MVVTRRAIYKAQVIKITHNPFRAVACGGICSILLFHASICLADDPNTLSLLFSEGRADRLSWERWFGTLQDDKRAGADFWATQRSKPKPIPCSSPPPDSSAAFVHGCVEARDRLAVPDIRRKTEPDYRAGFNAEVSPLAVLSAPNPTTPGKAPEPPMKAPAPARPPRALPVYGIDDIPALAALYAKSPDYFMSNVTGTATFGAHGTFAGFYRAVAGKNVWQVSVFAANPSQIQIFCFYDHDPNAELSQLREGQPVWISGRVGMPLDQKFVLSANCEVSPP